MVRDFEVREESSVSALRHRLFAQGYQGILIQFHRGDPGWFREFDFTGFAVVSLTSDFENEPIMSIRPRQHRMVRELYRKMLARGYRRIGAVLWHPTAHTDDAARLAGFIAAQTECDGGGFESESLFLVQPGGESSKFRHWIESYRPDALIIISTREASWLDALPKKLRPRGHAVLLLPSSGTTRPQPATAGYTRNSRLIGTLAVDWLEQSIRLRRTGLLGEPLLLSVPPLWIEGVSLPS